MIPMLDALEVLNEYRSDEVVLSVFTAVRHWDALSRHPELDLPFWGAMGKASSTGLGLAVARPDVRVWVIDGDGSLLMNLGALVTAAHMAPRNFVHIVLENGQYATTGGQPIPGASRVDFVGLARSAGYPHAYAFDDAASMQRDVGTLLGLDGPVLIDLKVTQSPVSGGGARRGTKQAMQDVATALAARS
jgi:thiamine pyrophosphate-dependent acetolactate synthase large subunit-like protein